LESNKSKVTMGH